MDYRDLWKQEHRASFAIAATFSATKLEPIRERIYQLLETGAAFQQAKAALQELLA
jgi:hypothetical protein